MSPLEVIPLAALALQVVVAGAFRVFDTDNDGVIDILEAMVGLALVSQMSPEEVRKRVIFRHTDQFQ